MAWMTVILSNDIDITHVFPEVYGFSPVMIVGIKKNCTLKRGECFSIKRTYLKKRTRVQQMAAKCVRPLIL
jgi:hypothetical protein